MTLPVYSQYTFIFEFELEDPDKSLVPNLSYDEPLKLFKISRIEYEADPKDPKKPIIKKIVPMF